MDLLLVLWPKQVINNISGTSIVPVRIISINTEASATKDRVDSFFTEPSDGHTESHCSNTSNIPKRVVYSVHISALIMTVVMAGAGERFKGNT